MWRYARGRLRPVGPVDAVEAPAVRIVEGTVERDPAEPRWIAPLPGVDGYWYELTADPEIIEEAAERIKPVLGQLVAGEGDVLRLAEELADRLEEIELLYSISEVLGRTIRLDEAAQTIARAVSDVVGARRCSILAHDEAANMLRPVAGWGVEVTRLQPVRVEDPDSIAARVFRDRRMIGFDPVDPAWRTPGRGLDPTYRGAAFLSAPILYPAPDGRPRPVGVINLTDRMGTDAFSVRERRLVGAIANQIGAAIENARLVERDRRQERVRRELELAHDLQMSLLPRPASLGLGSKVGARCEPAESVGGDFFHVLKLHGQQIGVMLGDVSSHGFGAALIMALALSAAGIYAAESESPEETLTRLYDFLASELARTEMHLALFYATIDPLAGLIRYANAGHPHAFRLSAAGEATRLGATAPPLGLNAAEPVVGQRLRWRCGSDLLILMSDGITDARDRDGRRFGEEAVLGLVREHFDDDPGAIVDAVFDAVSGWAARPTDDRTLLVVRC